MSIENFYTHLQNNRINCPRPYISSPTYFHSAIILSPGRSFVQVRFVDLKLPRTFSVNIWLLYWGSANCYYVSSTTEHIIAIIASGIIVRWTKFKFAEEDVCLTQSHSGTLFYLGPLWRAAYSSYDWIIHSVERVHLPNCGILLQIGIKGMQRVICTEHLIRTFPLRLCVYGTEARIIGHSCKTFGNWQLKTDVRQKKVKATYLTSASDKSRSRNHSSCNYR